MKIAVLREYLLLEFKDLKDKLPFTFDFERLVDDWVFLVSSWATISFLTYRRCISEKVL